MKKNVILLFACLLGALFFTACNGGDPKESKEYKDLKAELDKIKSEDSLSNANIELYKKIVDINDTTELSQFDNYMHADLNYHDMPEGMPNGLEGFKALMKEYFTSIPNMKVDILHILAEGDIVMVHVNLKGVNSGASMGMPATGKSVDVRGFDCIRVVDGKIKEYWSVVDAMKMMMQMGLMPDMAAAEDGKKGK
jgi:predicted ester cyclase